MASDASALAAASSGPTDADGLMFRAEAAQDQNDAEQSVPQEEKDDEEEVKNWKDAAPRPSFQSLFLRAGKIRDLRNELPWYVSHPWDPLSVWREHICKWVKRRMKDSKSLHKLAECFAPDGPLQMLCANPQTIHQTLARPIIPLWSDILQHKENRDTVSMVLQLLVKGKHHSVLPRVMHHLRPVRITQLDAGVGPLLHYLLTNATGIRYNMFRLLLSDSMAFYFEQQGTSSELVDEESVKRSSNENQLRCLEAILSQTNQQGSSLRELLLWRKNRDVLADFLEEYPHAQPLMQASLHSQLPSSTTAAPENPLSEIQTSLSKVNSCSSASSSSVPRSRLNFITFDRIEHRDLTRDWQKSIAIAQPALSEPANLHAKDLGVHTVEGLLSSDECKNLIKQTGFQDSLDGEYLRSDRDATRLLVQSSELATLLWERLQPSLARILQTHPTPLIPMGFGTFGEWLPSHINACMRFSAYQPGSLGFAPHRDAGFVQSTCERSIFTLLIYLNGEDSSSATSGTESHQKGRTAFYQPTQFKKGCLVSEEKPQRLFSIRPSAGRALLFPHDLLHGGDALLKLGNSIKHVLRTDVVFRRYERTPIMPVEYDWRNSEDFTRAVELFQMAFKHELAGEVALASECYERCTNLRVAELRKRQGIKNHRCGEGEKQPVERQVSLPCPALRLIPDCMRVLSTFLTPIESLAAAGTCHTWWQIRAPPIMKKKATITFIPRVKPSIPLTAEILIKKKLRALRPKAFFEKVLPTWHFVGGITSIMSYPLKFYKSNQEACLRVLSIYAAALFSHRLPTLQKHPDLIAHQSSKLGPMLATPPRAKRKPVPEEDQQRWEKYLDELRNTRIVLSYSPAQNSNPSSVEWCSFQDLITSTFKAQDVKLQSGTVDDFNDVAPNAVLDIKIDDPVEAAAREASPPSHSPVQLSKSYLFGGHQIASAGAHSRYSVSFLGLLPTSFYHAAMCCSQMFAGEGARHEFRCERFDDVRKKKIENQTRRRKEHRWNDAVELRSFDQATAQSRFQAATSAINESSRNVSNQLHNPLDMITVTVQEMRSDDGRAYFRVSFIGIPCL